MEIAQNETQLFSQFPTDVYATLQRVFSIQLTPCLKILCNKILCSLKIRPFVSNVSQFLIIRSSINPLYCMHV